MNLPRFYVWEGSDRRFLIFDREAVYIDSLDRRNKGDFTRDAAGKALMYETSALAERMALEFYKINPEPKTTTGYRVERLV